MITFKDVGGGIFGHFGTALGPMFLYILTAILSFFFFFYTAFSFFV